MLMYNLQGFIDEPKREWTVEELPQIYGDHSTNDIRDKVLMLHGLAVKMRNRRQLNGALRLDQPKLEFALDKDTGLPNGCTAYEASFLLK